MSNVKYCVFPHPLCFTLSYSKRLVELEKKKKKKQKTKKEKSPVTKKKKMQLVVTTASYFRWFVTYLKGSFQISQEELFVGVC